MVLDMKTARAASDGLASVKAGLDEADARDQEQGATVASNAHAISRDNLVAEFDAAHPDVDWIVSSCLAGKTIKAEKLTDPDALRSCLRDNGAKQVRKIPEDEYESGSADYGTYAITEGLSANDATGTALDLAREADYAMINGVGVIVLPQKTARRAESFADAATEAITSAAEADDSEIANNFAGSEADLLFEFEQTTPGAAPALAAKVARCAGEAR